MSLNNLSNGLAELGRRKPALEAIEEAVESYRQLAAARPEAFLPDLAMSLNNLALRLADLGRREPALEAIEEAITIYQVLARHHPALFARKLAASLEFRDQLSA